MKICSSILGLLLCVDCLAPAADLEALVSRADIVLDRPVARKEGGMPVGNGTMGSLVWTTPEAMKFQINLVAVHTHTCRSFCLLREAVKSQNNST